MNILTLQYCNSETEQIPVESIFAQNDVVGLYFTIPSGIGCIAFLDPLLDVYSRLRESGKKFEVLQVDCSQIPAIRRRCNRIELAPGPPPWKVLPEACVSALAAAYRIRRVPALVILRPNGEVISYDYCTALDKLRCNAWKRWVGDHVIDRMPLFMLTVEHYE